MITARYEPHLFAKERTPSPHLGRRGCTPPPNDGSDDIDRFMELAHAALEEATKEEDAKGVLQELVERVLAKTGAPLMAGIITEQLRSQEVIEQLAERSFERQAIRRRQRLYQGSTMQTKQRRSNILSPTSTHRPSSSPLQKTKSSSSSPSVVSSPSTVPVSSSISAPSSCVSSTTISSLKDPHDSDVMDEEAVTRDQFIIQQTSPLHTQPDRLLLVSEYIWRLFRLLILACLVALVYHYVCSYPQQWFI